MRKISTIIFVSLFLLLRSFCAHSFEIGTHRDVSRQAAFLSNLDNFLKTKLNFPGGVNDQVLGKRIFEWIEDGSEFEDDFPRYLHHYHNPLRDWRQAGLRIGGLPVGNSSILWGQRVELQLPLDENYTWYRARDEYFNGLTANTQAEREDHLARTFRTLGHQIHLVQDAANPAHTRNDPHVFNTGIEAYVEDIRINDMALFEQLASGCVGFDPTILTLSPNPVAPIPIARIIDTTDPEQTSASPSAGTNQGIAEYSNANFLSLDTIFEDFTFPRVGSLGPGFDETEPVTGRPRRYFPKEADGETGFRLVAEGTLTERLNPFVGNQGYVLDRGVFQDYAEKLLPRAIGYSAGLLDYFFRGEIEVDQINAESITITNRSSETMDGTFTLYYDAADGTRKQVSDGSWTLPSPLQAGDTSDELTFTEPTDFAEGNEYIIVFEGTLGSESNAVVGKIWECVPFELVGYFGEKGTGDGQFNNPSRITTDDKNIYVIDSGNSRIQIFDINTNEFVAAFGSFGYGDNQFINLRGIAVDSNYIYVSNASYNKGTFGLKIFDKVSRYNFIAGFSPYPSDSYPWEDGFSCCGDGDLVQPGPVVVDDDYIYVADYWRNDIQVFEKTSPYNFVTKFGSPGLGSGEFDGPGEIAIANDSIYVTDMGNNRVQIFNNVIPYSYITEFSEGQLESPQGIAVDSKYIYIGEPSGQKLRVFTVDYPYTFVKSLKDELPNSYVSSYGLTVTSELLYFGDIRDDKVYTFRICPQ